MEGERGKLEGGGGIRKRCVFVTIKYLLPFLWIEELKRDLNGIILYYYYVMDILQLHKMHTHTLYTHCFVNNTILKN